MSHTENDVLSGYNSLLDKNLYGYFSNTKMRKQLTRSGLIDRDGRITSENAYRMKMAKKEHRDNVRDLLASAIVDKALDMERMRRYEIRRRLEELYKIELVQKVRSDRGKRVNDDLVALLTPRKKSGKHRKAKSAAVTKTEKKDSKLPIIRHTERPKKLYYEHDESTHSNSLGSPRSSDKKMLHPHPPPGKSKKKKRNIHRGLMLAKSDNMVAHRVQLQSMAEVTMKYLGSPLNLTNNIFPSSKLAEVQIIQQHCGASTICVFRELLPANTLFTFVSRRHRGCPFGLTIYVDGIQNIRISSCCEYKHNPGHRVGGKNSQFGLVAVQGAAPCYRCQIRLNLTDKNKSAKNEDQASSSDEESAVNSYDIIVSRASRHSDSKLERPVSAHVMTQTIDNDNKEEENKADETNEYQDDEFEEDIQFASNQEKLSSDTEALSSSSSSETESGSEDSKKEAEEDDQYSVSKSSDSDRGETSSDVQEANNEEEKKNQTDDEKSDSGGSSSDESEKYIENEEEVSSGHEKSSEVEESSEAEKTDEEKGNDNIEQDDNNEIMDHVNIEKDESSDDESTLSASSRSSHSGSDHEEAKKDKESDVSDDVGIKDDDNENEKSSETDAVMSDKASNSEASDQDKDSDTEVADTSDASDSEMPHDDEVKDEVKNEEDADDAPKANEEELDEDQLGIKEEEDDLGIRNEDDENDSSSSDGERATSVISRESTMLTGNEDGNCDAANKTIQFNEEVDVVTYAKAADGTSTEEEVAHSDDSEGEFESVNITGGNIILADLGDDGENINDLANGTEDININSDEDKGNAHALFIKNSIELKGDRGDKPEKRIFKDGSVRSFVDSWRNVRLENLYLTENQTNELISLLEEKKDDIVYLSLKNTVVDGGIETIKYALKQLTNLLDLNLSSTNMGPDEMEHLLEILLDGVQEIETLILRGNPIDDEGTSILTSGIARLKYLNSLDISKCKVGDDGAESLFDYLSENTTLTQLRLSSNKFDLEGWRYISSALKVNTTLATLAVDSNNMGDEAIQILCNGILKNTSLDTLDVRNNSLTDLGGDALYAAIVKCTTLRDVSIMPKNLFSEEMQDKLIKLIDLKIS